MHAFRQLYLAHLREWWRDPTALLWSMLFPIVIALTVGVIFAGSGRVFFRIGVVNDAGETGLRIITAFKTNKAFEITTGTRRAELDALKRGKREAVVVLTPEIGAALSDPQAALTSTSGQIPLELHFDPTTLNGQAAANLIQQALVMLDAQLTGKLPLLTLDPQNIDSQRLSTADYMLPGVLAMSMMLLGLYVTAIPLVSLREKQVLRRMGATPLTRVILLASQFAFRLTIALLQALIIIAISVVLFDLPLHWRDLPATVGVVLIGAAVFIVFGYLLASVAKTEEAIQVVAGLPFIIFSMLSGVLVPIWRIPGPMRPVVDAIPLTYLADALRQTMTGANGSYSLATDLSILAAWLVICALLAIRFFRWEPMS